MMIWEHFGQVCSDRIWSHLGWRGVKVRYRVNWKMTQNNMLVCYKDNILEAPRRSPYGFGLFWTPFYSMLRVYDTQKMLNHYFWNEITHRYWARISLFFSLIKGFFPLPLCFLLKLVKKSHSIGCVSTQWWFGNTLAKYAVIGFEVI